jgi:competence protein ComEC
MSFPFLFLAFSLAGGILLAAVANPPLLPVLFLFFFALALSWTFHFRKKIELSFFLILVTTLLLGSNLYLASDAHFKKNTLFRFQAVSYVDFYGTVYRSVSPEKNSDTLFLKVNTVVHQNREERIQGRLQVTVARSSPFSNPQRLFVGDTVKVAAQLIPSKGYQNFNPPYLERWQKTQRIHQRAFSKSPLLVQKVASGSTLSPLRRISILRQHFIQKIEEFFTDSGENPSFSPQGGVLEALLLGERGRMDEHLSLALQKAGLYHLFAISGAHIALLSFILFFFLRILRIPTRPSYVILMILLIFYAFLVEGRPSIFRATVMTLFFLLGKLIWRETNLLNTISFSAFVLLVINPFSLFDPGFQLTFTATLAIILFFPKVKKVLPKLPLRVSEILAVSITAQLGVLPIMARVFNRITFSSLLLNFAALPLVALIMLSGYLFLLLTFFSAFLSGWLAEGLRVAINGLVSLSHVLDSFTFFSFRIPTPHLVTIAGYYIFSSLLLFSFKKKKWKWPLAAAFLTFFVLLVTYPFPPVSKELKVTFIDVGQGDSILVEFPGKKKMLVDGGGLPSNDFNIGERVVSPFLWKKGIKTVDFMVLTHAHPDHMNGFLSVVENFKIREFWESLSPVENTSYSQLQQNLNRSTVSRRIFRGQTFNFDGVTIDILHPQEREPRVLSIDNDQSAVLRLTYGRTSFLLAADIGVEAERDILASGLEVRSDVLKSPHHGSRSSSSQDFLEGVDPQFVVISAGERNRYGLPDLEVLNRYREFGATVLRTDIHGAVQISSDGRTLQVKTAVDHLK